MVRTASETAEGFVESQVADEVERRPTAPSVHVHDTSDQCIRYRVGRPYPELADQEIDAACISGFCFRSALSEKTGLSSRRRRGWFIGWCPQHRRHRGTR